MKLTNIKKEMNRRGVKKVKQDDKKFFDGAGTLFLFYFLRRERYIGKMKTDNILYNNSQHTTTILQLFFFFLALFSHIN